MEKLREKKQSEKQRRQAHHAVTLYLDLVFKLAEKAANNHLQQQDITEKQSLHSNDATFCQENKGLREISNQTREPGAVDKEELKLSGADWIGLYNDLNDAIKVRHYSPSTLKIYLSWTRQFQTYTGSKDYQ